MIELFFFFFPRGRIQVKELGVGRSGQNSFDSLLFHLKASKFSNVFIQNYPRMILLFMVV